MPRSRLRLPRRHPFVLPLLPRSLEPHRLGRRLLLPRAHNLQQLALRLPRREPLPRVQGHQRDRVYRPGQTCHSGLRGIAVPCQRAIADLCLTFRANVQAGRVRDSRFVRSSRAKADRGLAVPEQSLRVLLSTAEGRCRPERVLDRALQGVLACCRRCRTRCRPKRSQESRSMRAGLRRASGLRLTSERLKGNASYTRRARAREPAVALLPRLSLRRPNHARRAK